MRIKLFFIVVTISALIFFFWTNKAKETDNPESSTSTVDTPIKFKKDNIKPKVKKAPIADESIIKPTIKPVQSKNEEPIDIIYRELGAERYSQEPALELMSVMREMFDCGFIKSYKRYKFIEKTNQLSIAQQDIYRTYQDNCIQVNDTYPTIIEFNQSSARSRKQDFMWIMMNSPYRELMVNSKNFKKLDSYAQEQFVLDLTKAMINSHNSQMLLFLSTILSEEREFLNALKLPEFLSSINIAYVQMIVGKAALLMSCEYNNGISCAPSSHTMTVICFENESACGMDVKSWFKVNHSFSHNHEINKVIAYFKAL